MFAFEVRVHTFILMVTMTKLMTFYTNAMIYKVCLAHEKSVK